MTDTTTPDSNPGRALAAMRKTYEYVCAECSKKFVAQKERTPNTSGNRYCSNTCKCAYSNRVRRKK